jgi:RNA polymerase-binding transcription factor DksA
MASKKKAAKPAKKAAPSKKAAPAKKPVAKKPAPKKAAKPAPPKKAVVAGVAKKSVAKPAAKPVIAAKHVNKIEVKKPVPPPPPAKHVEEKKAEIKGVVSGKTIKLVSAPPVPVKKKSELAKPTKVVMPEIKTKTARKYEPEFTKSVLDQPGNIQTGPTMRYSDVDLGEFRELIQKKLDQAKKELAYLQGLITRKDEMGGDETENRYMTMEDGSMSMEREQLAQMASRQINYIDHLEKALMRIENKTYGICRVTGKLIDKARLRAVPHATLSIEAKQMMNK